VLDSVLEPIVGVELPKEVFISRARWMSLVIEWNTSAIMFYRLNNLLLLIIVIFKLKCINLIFNEIMVLNASYVCLHAFSLRWESPDPDPGRWTAHFLDGSITLGLRLNKALAIPSCKMIEDIICYVISEGLTCGVGLHRWFFCEVRSTSPTVAPRSKGSIPMSQTCDWCRPNSQKRHPPAMGLDLHKFG
jgi:hypothetical protein